MIVNLEMREQDLLIEELVAPESMRKNSRNGHKTVLKKMKKAA